MLSTNLATILRPYKRLANKHALATTYRVLCLQDGLVIGCSPSMILETKCDHGIAGPTFVDAQAFLATMDSLPAEKEVTLSVADNVLSWQCGAARGKFATIAVENMPSVPPRNKKAKAFKPSSLFIRAMSLGALSCDNEALLSIGMYGVVFDGESEPFAIYSSDNSTISVGFVDDVTVPLAGRMSLPPDAVRMLAEVMLPVESADAKMQFDSDGIYYQDKYCRLVVKQTPPLQHDAFDTIMTYDTEDTLAAIPQEAISAFVKRAAALAESRKHVHIKLSAEKGQIGLTFEEGVASSEEVYLIDGLDIPDVPPIQLDAMKMARALSHCSEVSLDHMDRSVLVVRGKEPDFRYIISGRRQATGA